MQHLKADICRRLSTLVPRGINLRAQMRWYKLRRNLWRISLRRQTRLINFILCHTNLPSAMLPDLPAEVKYMILSRLSGNQLLALIQACKKN